MPTTRDELVDECDRLWAELQQFVIEFAAYCEKGAEEKE